jgi:transcriptional regulator with XRE-family HTH domain
MYPNLKMQLWKVGIRQNRLAQLLHMDETALSRIVNGFRKPSGELREKLARVLNCEEEWLFEEIEPMPPAVPDGQKAVSE